MCYNTVRTKEKRKVPKFPMNVTEKFSETWFPDSYSKAVLLIEGGMTYDVT